MSDNEENLVERDYEGEMRIKMSEEEDNEENLVERDYEGEKRIKMREEEDWGNLEERVLKMNEECKIALKMSEELNNEISEAFDKLEKKLADMGAEQNEKFEEMNLKLQKQQDMLAECFTYFE